VHILWIKTEFLHPVDKGGRIRTYQMLRALKRDHRVTYLTLDDGSAAPDAAERATEYCHTVERVPFAPPAKGSGAFWLDLARNAVSPLPYAVGRYRSAALRERISALCARGDVDVVVCDFLAPSLNVPDGLGVPTVLFQHNVEAMIWERHAQVASHPVKRAYMREQWRRMLRHERAECRRFDRVIAVSPQDAEVFSRDFGLGDVSHVPTGVDTEFFRPSGSETRQPRELVFTGSMDWMPNEDAMKWFAADILPLIQKRVPDVTVTVVGRNPPASVRALADSHPAIRVTGSVPDVRPYIERAAAFIVPIRVGGGTRLKIFEALAMERPVISTAIGAEGLPVRDGVDAILADEPQAFADAVADLLGDPARAERIGQAAAAAVRAEYGWDGVAARFADICKRVADSRDAARPETSRTASTDAPALTLPASS
jgi:sugar transferase (PEP-CTERM/EpsH1 system associated)